MNNDELIKALTAIAQTAGKFMLGADEHRRAEAKTSARDLVTVADIKSQDLITGELKKAYPTLPVLSEELPEAQHAQMYEAGFTGFVVDPIDGTYNFKRDMRDSAISVGYVEHGKPQAGVIYNPYREELFSVVAGKGARCNSRPIRVSGQAELAGASITFSNSYDDAAMARNLQRHLAIFEQTNIMPWTNCPGSGVIIMTHLATGRMDAYHHNGLKPWDNAVGFLLIREAGGKVLTLKGEHASFTSPTIIGGTPQLVDKIVAIFSKINPQLLN